MLVLMHVGCVTANWESRQEPGRWCHLQGQQIPNGPRGASDGAQQSLVPKSWGCCGLGISLRNPPRRTQNILSPGIWVDRFEMFIPARESTGLSGSCSDDYCNVMARSVFRHKLKPSN
ncbi:hypothetical protein AV530_003029 [Patagioenas fasciata monilis]|uniref:Uncharacterized protein n=1 Tax=Patagioenas fasciata monilis TaxID=372326 RepID=A0A1V4KVT8_PATFA|nr:hypothetical protein AV530_003029 [Patagioenas fasciata monilis]